MLYLVLLMISLIWFITLKKYFFNCSDAKKKKNLLSNTYATYSSLYDDYTIMLIFYQFNYNISDKLYRVMHHCETQTELPLKIISSTWIWLSNRAIINVTIAIIYKLTIKALILNLHHLTMFFCERP